MKPTSIHPGKPWYREPWPWILMAGPFLVIVAGVITTYLAVSSSDGLVEDDYYKQGLAVNQRTLRNQRAGEMNLRAEVFPGGAASPLLRVSLRAATGVLPDTLLLHVTHPTRSGRDQHVRLQREGSGFYTGKLLAPLSGRWYMAMEDEQQTWRLAGAWDVDQQPVLSLAPASRSGESRVN